MWESHSDSNRIARKSFDSEVGKQSGDSRTRERRKVGVVIEEREQEMEGRNGSRLQELAGQLRDLREKKMGTPTGGSTCRWEEDDGPTVDLFPRVRTDHCEHLMIGGAKREPETEQSENKKMVRSKDGVRETSEGSGGWVTLSDL